MITIKIDEDACVGCSLCVDECPTDVFSFDEKKRLPVVEKAEMCFGCLSCSEICPSDAVDHEGIDLSSTAYHDEYPLRIADRLGTGRNFDEAAIEDEESLKKGLDDLGVRLLSVAAIFRQTVGGALPALGSLAGQTLAGQLPRYRVPETFEEALELMREQFLPTWDLNPALNGDDTLKIEVKNCFVREICQKEGLELGGELCTLFYNYLAGYLTKIGQKRMRLASAERGDSKCIYSVNLVQ